MDNTIIYVKMCQDSQEIQRHKTRFEGDVVYDTAGLKIEIVDKAMLIVYKRHPQIQQLDVWLPRQDQLQEMFFKWCFANAMLKSEMMLDIRYLNTGEIAIEAGKDAFYQVYPTFEQFWLTIVMNRLYKKKWNKAQETWIPL